MENNKEHYLKMIPEEVNKIKHAIVEIGSSTQKLLAQNLEMLEKTKQQLEDYVMKINSIQMESIRNAAELTKSIQDLGSLLMKAIDVRNNAENESSGNKTTG